MSDKYACGHEYMTGLDGRRFEVSCPICHDNQQEIERLTIETLKISNGNIACKQEIERLTTEGRDAFYAGHAAGWSCGIADVEPTLSQRDDDYQLWLKHSASGKRDPADTKKDEALALAWDALRWADSPDESDPCDQWTEIPRDRAQKAFEAVWSALGQEVPTVADVQEPMCEHDWFTPADSEKVKWGTYQMCSKCYAISNVVQTASTVGEGQPHE